MIWVSRAPRILKALSPLMPITEALLAGTHENPKVSGKPTIVRVCPHATPHPHFPNTTPTSRLQHAIPLPHRHAIEVLDHGLDLIQRGNGIRPPTAPRRPLHTAGETPKGPDKIRIQQGQNLAWDQV